MQGPDHQPVPALRKADSQGQGKGEDRVRGKDRRKRGEGIHVYRPP